MGCAPSQVTYISAETVHQNIDKMVVQNGSNRAKIPGLDTHQQQLITDTMEAALLSQRPDFFHKVWVRAIQKSPKMNEIIAFGQYCVRDLTEWPKLNSLATRCNHFFHKLVFDTRFDLDLSTVECKQLGAQHVNFSKFGFQPVFFDLWCLSFTEVVKTVEIAGDEDKGKMAQLVEAYKTFVVFIAARMVEGYYEERFKIQYGPPSAAVSRAEDSPS